MTQQNSQPESMVNKSGSFSCVKCLQPIREAHLLLADKHYWHEDCLRCACCDVRLAELDKVCYIKARMPLCRRDYLRLYGQTGECVVCQKRIFAFEFVMRIQEDVYHLNCFCCQRCQLRFCVGDKFYIQHKTILCENDYMDLSSTPNGQLSGDNMLFSTNTLPSTSMANNNGIKQMMKSTLKIKNNNRRSIETFSNQSSSSMSTPLSRTTLKYDYSPDKSSHFTHPMDEKNTCLPPSSTSMYQWVYNQSSPIFTEPVGGGPKLPAEDDIMSHQSQQISDDHSSGYGSPSSPPTSISDKI